MQAKLKLCNFQCQENSYKSQGGTHMLRHMGMCCPNGLLFHQKSLDKGPIFFKNILRHGSVFGEHPKIGKMGLHFEKNPYEWVPFAAEITLRKIYGYGFRAAFEIAVVRSPETTKTCVGQPKIMIWLSGGQPKIKSQKLLFSIVWSNLSNLLFINWLRSALTPLHWSQV